MKTATLVDNFGGRRTYSGPHCRDLARAHVSGFVSGFGCVYDPQLWKYLGAGFEVYQAQKPPPWEGRIGQAVAFVMICGGDE